MKKIKVSFAPGCFDQFEGSQEELDTLMKSIEDTFANMSPEDLELNSIEHNFSAEDRVLH